jgi:hypothetical protein
MTVVHPEIKRQLVSKFVLQDILRVDIWILDIIVVCNDLGDETSDVFHRPQSISIMDILKLEDYVRRLECARGRQNGDNSHSHEQIFGTVSLDQAFAAKMCLRKISQPLTQK